jgi:hypothetical protein
MSDDVISTLTAIGTALTAGSASGGTAAAIGGAAAASTAAGLASAGVNIAGAIKGPPKAPGLPSIGLTPEEEARRQADLEAARLRVGRGATLLTGSAGGPSLMSPGRPLKTTLGG